MRVKASGRARNSPRPGKQLPALRLPAPETLRAARWVARAVAAPPPVLTRIERTFCHQDFVQVARIRALGYYEDHNSRFSSSYIEQFARREARSLQQRTQLHGTVAPCMCFAVRRGEEERIVGTADLIPPACQTGKLPPGIPSSDKHGAFAANIVVERAWRGFGVGKQLVETLITEARLLGAKRIYAEVDPENLTAMMLYLKMGFTRCEDAVPHNLLAILVLSL